jgi:hypothetical protein
MEPQIQYALTEEALPSLSALAALAEADFELYTEAMASAIMRYQTAVKNQPNAYGRLGAGASSHCAHAVGGDVLREYLDWRPFRYFTNRMTPLD